MKFSKLVACAAFLLAGSSVFADTYAVCVGINDYPTSKNEAGEDVDSDLNGCVNDAKSMVDLLQTKFNVPADHIKLLTDGDATGDGFVAAVKWLIDVAKPGDQIVFSYSGHGARLDDATAEGGKESCIVLSDFQVVPGNIFKGVSRNLADAGVSSTFVFDSCFSGGMSRPDMGEFKIKRKSLGDIRMKDVKGIKNRKDFMGMQARSKAVKEDKGQYVFLFAGKDDQPTIDITLKDQPAHGLFTMLFLDAIGQNAATPVKDLFASLNAVLDEINSAIKEKRPDATPFDQKPGFDTSSEDRAEKPIVIG